MSRLQLALAAYDRMHAWTSVEHRSLATPEAWDRVASDLEAALDEAPDRGRRERCAGRARDARLQAESARARSGV